MPSTLHLSCLHAAKVAVLLVLLVLSAVVKIQPARNNWQESLTAIVKRVGCELEAGAFGGLECFYAT